MSESTRGGHAPDPFPDSFPLKKVASAHDCTGLYPALPQSGDQRDDLDELYDVME